MPDSQKRRSVLSGRILKRGKVCVAGVIDLKGRWEPDRALVQRMGAALAHRGPDDSGFLFAPGIGVAQRRLSIVGLEDGNQPIFNEDRTVAVICNGELFDYPEQKAEPRASRAVTRTARARV